MSFARSQYIYLRRDVISLEELILDLAGCRYKDCYNLSDLGPYADPPFVAKSYGFIPPTRAPSAQTLRTRFWC